MDEKKNVFIERFNKIVGKNATQEEIAQKINTSRQNVGNWLSGKSKPDIFMLAQIAKAYNVTADYLVGLADVSTTDIEVRNACETLHLPEEAVKAIKTLYDIDFETFETLSFLLSQADDVITEKVMGEHRNGIFYFYEPHSLLIAISKYLRISSKSKEKKYYISRSGRLLNNDPLEEDRENFDDVVMSHQVNTSVLVDAILIDNLKGTLTESKKEYRKRISELFNKPIIQIDEPDEYNKIDDDDFPF